MIETDRQLQIAKRARETGGYARKQSNRYTAGIPDLHIIIWNHAPFDVEVKDLGDVGDKPFNVQIKTTKLQRETMAAMNAVNPTSTAAFVMVTFKRGATIYVAALPADARCINSKEIDHQCTTLSNLSLPRTWNHLLYLMKVPLL